VKARFKKISVLTMFVLGYLTLGIYPWIWYLRRRDFFLHIARKPDGVPSRRSLVSPLVQEILVTVLGGVMDHVPEDYTALAAIVVLGLLVSLLLCWISIAFEYRHVLLLHSANAADGPERFSRFLTVLLGPMFLQFKMNRMFRPEGGNVPSENPEREEERNGVGIDEEAMDTGVFRCLSCGNRVRGSEAACRKCGWTYKEEDRRPL